MTGHPEEWLLPTDGELAIVEAERALVAAHRTLDLATLDRLLHPDYVILQPDGTTECKAQVLASFESGERHWDLAEVDQLEVRFHGQCAVVVGRWRARGRNGPHQFDYAARFLSVWVNGAGNWRNVAYQATEIPLSPS